MSRWLRGFALCIACMSGTDEVRAEDWPQFRGVNSAGISPTEPPISFGAGRNELWNTPLKSGHSSPCIAADRIYLTTFDPDQHELAVVCLARSTGAILWERAVRTDEIERGHPSFNPASSTPAADGERVVAYFGSFGLICFDTSGRELWRKQMPVTKSYAGNATSPAIIGESVILYRGNHVDHFLLAVDKHTGEELWKVPQEEPFVSELACTSCPVLAAGKLIVHSARSVQAFDPATGKLIWVAKCATTATSTPVIADGQVIVAAWNKMGEPALRPEFPDFDELIEKHDRNSNGRIGRDEFPRLMIFHRPDGAEAPQNGAAVRFRSSDRNGDGQIDATEWRNQLDGLAAFRARYQTHGLLAIALDSRGLVDQQRIRTLEKQAIPEVPSPLFHDGYVYCVKNGGVLTTVNLDAGRRTSRVRTRGPGTHYASPVIGGRYLFSTAGNGRITVLRVGAEPEIVAVNDLGERTYATPAIADGVLYVRTHDRLFAFGDNTRP